MALQTLLQEVASLRAVISQNQASNTQQQYQVPANIQFPPPPPVQHYAPPPPPPMINHTPAMPMPPAPPTPTQQQYYALPQQKAYNNYNGRCRGCNGGRGCGGCNNNAAQQNNPPHPIKRYNHWWYCYSCGFGTPHEGHLCTRQAAGHIPSLTWDQKIAEMHLQPDQQQYRNASYAGHHKHFLPLQAAANRYLHYQQDN